MGRFHMIEQELNTVRELWLRNADGGLATVEIRSDEGAALLERYLSSNSNFESVKTSSGEEYSSSFTGLDGTKWIQMNTRYNSSVDAIAVGGAWLRTKLIGQVDDPLAVKYQNDANVRYFITSSQISSSSSRLNTDRSQSQPVIEKSVRPPPPAKPERTSSMKSSTALAMSTPGLSYSGGKLSGSTHAGSAIGLLKANSDRKRSSSAGDVLTANLFTEEQKVLLMDYFEMVSDTPETVQLESLMQELGSSGQDGKEITTESVKLWFVSQKEKRRKSSAAMKPIQSPRENLKNKNLSSVSGPRGGDEDEDEDDDDDSSGAQGWQMSGRRKTVRLNYRLRNMRHFEENDEPDSPQKPPRRNSLLKQRPTKNLPPAPRVPRTTLIQSAAPPDRPLRPLRTKASPSPMRNTSLSQWGTARLKANKDDTSPALSTSPRSGNNNTAPSPRRSNDAPPISPRSGSGISTPGKSDRPLPPTRPASRTVIGGTGNQPPNSSGNQKPTKTEEEDDNRGVFSVSEGSISSTGVVQVPVEVDNGEVLEESVFHENLDALFEYVLAGRTPVAVRYARDITALVNVAVQRATGEELKRRCFVLRSMTANLITVTKRCMQELSPENEDALEQAIHNMKLVGNQIITFASDGGGTSGGTSASHLGRAYSDSPRATWSGGSNSSAQVGHGGNEDDADTPTIVINL